MAKTYWLVGKEGFEKPIPVPPEQTGWVKISKNKRYSNRPMELSLWQQNQNRSILNGESVQFSDFAIKQLATNLKNMEMAMSDILSSFKGTSRGLNG